MPPGACKHAELRNDWEGGGREPPLDASREVEERGHGWPPCCMPELGEHRSGVLAAAWGRCRHRASRRPHPLRSPWQSLCSAKLCPLGPGAVGGQAARQPLPPRGGIAALPTADAFASLAPPHRAAAADAVAALSAGSGCASVRALAQDAIVRLGHVGPPRAWRRLQGQRRRRRPWVKLDPFFVHVAYPPAAYGDDHGREHQEQRRVSYLGHHTAAHF